MDGPIGPNFIVPTPPANDSSNRSASTQFVTVAISSAIAALAPSINSTQTDFISGGVSSPANQDYRIIEYAPFAMTLNAVYAKLSTGTVTAIISINASSIPVTGGTVSIGTSQVSSVLSAINTVALGSTLILTVSGTANSPANLSFVVQFTRTFS